MEEPDFTQARGSYSPDWLRMPAQRNTRLQLPTFANECSEADPMLGGDHLRSLLANHDRRRIRVSGDHRRHDTRVRHTQLADPLHAQPRVDNTADPAGRRRLVHGKREVQRKLFEQRVARHVALAVAMLLSEEGRDHDRPRPAVAWPMRGDVY